MKKSILKLLIVITIISLILMLFAGCKSPDTSELEERIEKLELEKTIKEMEDELAEKEAEESTPEEEEEEPPEVATDTEQMEEEEDGGEEPGDADTDTDVDADAGADPVVDADKEAPTISLTIYEGPTLDGSICYYRIQATVTGSPTVSFSKDDSGGAWGSKKVQINLNNPGDTYNLTATAKNSEGSTTDSITLDWGCAIPTPDPIIKDADLGADIILSGYIIEDVGTYSGNEFSGVGDANNNKQIMSFLSFNISSISNLDGVTIKDVSVTIPISSIVNNPEMSGDKVYIGVYDYGNSLDYADLGLGGTLIEILYTSDSLTDLNLSSSGLKDELQKAVNIDKKWFQLGLYLNYVSFNSIDDAYIIPVDTVVIHIKYEIPG